jgi:hypothetical protein
MNLLYGSNNLFIERIKLIHGTSKQTLWDRKLSQLNMKKSCETPKTK